MVETFLSDGRMEPIIVTAAAAFPVSATVAASLSDWTPARRLRHEGLVLFAIAVLGFLIHNVAASLSETMVCFATEVVVLSLFQRTAGWRIPFTPTGLWWFACVCFAVVVPAAHQSYRLEQQLVAAEDFRSQGRLLKFLEAAKPLARRAAERSVDGVSLQEQIRRGESLVRQFQSAASQPLPADAPPEHRVAYARMLAALDEFDRAEKVLRRSSPRSLEEQFLLAAVLQKARRFEESTSEYQSAIRLLDRNDAHFSTLAMRAVNAIAFNHREQQRYRDAEQVYLLARQHVPQAADEIHLNLGRHYVLAGRFALAAEHLHRAARSSRPTIASEASKELTQLRQHTPACLLPTPR